MSFSQSCSLDLPVLTELASSLNKVISIFDIESTDFVGRKNFGITEIGVLQIHPDGKQEIITSLVNPEFPINKKVVEKTKITNEMVSEHPNFEFYWLEFFKEVASNGFSIGFNSIDFDCKGIVSQFKRYSGEEIVFSQHCDVRSLCCFFNNGTLDGKLEDYCSSYGVTLKGDAHRADYDAKLTALLCESILSKFGSSFINHEVAKLSTKKVPAYVKTELSSGVIKNYSISEHYEAIKKEADFYKDLEHDEFESDEDEFDDSDSDEFTESSEPASNEEASISSIKSKKAKKSENRKYKNFNTVYRKEIFFKYGGFFIAIILAIFLSTFFIEEKVDYNPNHIVNFNSESLSKVGINKVVTIDDLNDEQKLIVNKINNTNAHKALSNFYSSSFASIIKNKCENQSAYSAGFGVMDSFYQFVIPSDKSLNIEKVDFKTKLYLISNLLQKSLNLLHNFENEFPDTCEVTTSNVQDIFNDNVAMIKRYMPYSVSASSDLMIQNGLVYYNHFIIANKSDMSSYLNPKIENQTAFNLFMHDDFKYYRDSTINRIANYVYGNCNNLKLYSSNLFGVIEFAFMYNFDSSVNNNVRKLVITELFRRGVDKAKTFDKIDALSCEELINQSYAGIDAAINYAASKGMDYDLASEKIDKSGKAYVRYLISIGEL